MDRIAFLDAYDRLTSGVRRTMLRRTSALFREVDRYLAWCTSRDVDPERWAEARHMAAWKREAGALIPVSRLPAEGFVPAFREWADDRTAEAVGQRRLSAEAVWDVVPGGRELTVLAERMKSVLASDPELCRVSDLTAGFNPASPWCGRCPSVSCRREAVTAGRVARAGG